MWQLWIVALFPLTALQGVDHDSKEGLKRSQQEFRDGLSRSNKTVPENETSAPWRSAWVVSTSGPLLTGQSSPDYKANPTIPSKYLSASFYAKYLVPLLIVLVILLVLFLMYRRKRGREIHSSMESINESSDSDNEVPPSVEQMAEVSFLPEGIKPFSQDNTSIAGAESTISNQENASDTRKQLPTQA